MAVVDIRRSMGVLFVTAPVIAGLAGYHFYGLLCCIAWAIGVLPLLGFGLIGAMTITLWLKFMQDRRRILRLPSEDLCAIVNHPANADFGLAFRELGRRHIDTRAAHASLITMLVSSNMRERQLGLARLKELHPKLRNAIDTVIEDSPEQLHTQVIAALHKRRRQSC